MRFIYVFNFWLLWVFTAAFEGLPLVVASRAGDGESYSLVTRRGFSLQWLLLLQRMGSGCLGFSSCGTQA